MNTVQKLLVPFFCAFVACPAFIVLHECGHFMAGRSLGWSARLHYAESRFVSPVLNLTVNANGEEITIQAGGSGFPTVGGLPFFDVYLAFRWISGSGTNIIRDFVDTGGGQTFADMVGVSPLDFLDCRRTCIR
jgi:hypothetical protein